MNRTIEYYENRIHRLEQRDAVANKNIISKIRRKIKMMKAAGNTGRE